MIRSVEFELHTLRERNQRGASIGARMALAAREKEQRQTTSSTLRRQFGHPPLWHVFPTPGRPDFTKPNRIRVTLVRLSPGRLDDDGVDDAMKNVRDGVADWFTVDDRDQRITWVYEQERSPSAVHKVRIEIADLGPGADHRVVLATAAEREGGPLVQVRKRGRVQQLALVARKSYAAFPWEQPPCPGCGGSGTVATFLGRGVHVSAEETHETCTTCSGTGRKGRRVAHLPRFDRVADPPEKITVPVPAAQADRYLSPTITLSRRSWSHRTLGECFLYIEERTIPT